MVAYLAIFPSKQIGHPGALPKILPRGDFPSPLFFRDVPEKGCSATAVYFWMVSAYHAELLTNQTCVFSSSVNAL